MKGLPVSGVSSTKLQVHAHAIPIMNRDKHSPLRAPAKSGVWKAGASSPMPPAVMSTSNQSEGGSGQRRTRSQISRLARIMVVTGMVMEMIPRVRSSRRVMAVRAGQEVRVNRIRRESPQKGHRKKVCAVLMEAVRESIRRDGEVPGIDCRNPGHTPQRTHPRFGTR